MGWGNNNTIGFLLLIVSPLVLYLIDNSQDKKTKILAIIFIAFVFLGIILTFSRQTYLFFGLFLTFYLIYKLLKEKNKRVANVILLLFWITSVCSSFFILKYNGFLQSFGLENSETLFHRFDLWKNSLAAFKEHPLLGGGFFFLSGDPAVKLPGIMPLCSHNTFFEFLGATGLVGTICYLFYRFFGLRKVFPILNKEQFYVFVCYMLSVLISLIDIHLFDLFGTAVCTTLFVFSFSSNFHLDKENLFRENKDLSDNSGEVEG